MRRTPRRGPGRIRRSKGRGASRVDRSTHIVAPRQVLAAFADRPALPLRGAPYRTYELEVRLTRALGAFGRGDAGASKREIHVTERKSRHVREASLVSRDEPAACSLDGVGARLVGGLARADVTLDLADREAAKRDTRANGETQLASGRGDDGDLGADLVRLAGERREHRDRLRIATRLAEAF